MQAGKLNRRVTVQVQTPAQDEAGQPIDSQWSTVLNAWAEIKGLTGKEVFALGAGFSGQLTHRITIRYTHVPLAGGMRVLYGQRTFTVQLVENTDEANVQLKLICLEQP